MDAGSTMANRLDPAGDVRVSGGANARERPCVVLQAPVRRAKLFHEQGPGCAHAFAQVMCQRRVASVFGLPDCADNVASLCRTDGQVQCITEYIGDCPFVG